MMDILEELKIKSNNCTVPGWATRAANEIERLRGLMGEQLREITVEAIRESTGCPDIKGLDGEYLTDKILAKARLLMVRNAPHEGPARASCAGPLDAVVMRQANVGQNAN